MTQVPRPLPKGAIKPPPPPPPPPKRVIKEGCYMKNNSLPDIISPAPPMPPVKPPKKEHYSMVEQLSRLADSWDATAKSYRDHNYIGFTEKHIALTYDFCSDSLRLLIEKFEEELK